MSPLIQNIIRFAIIMAIQLFLLNNVEVHDATVLFGVSLFKPFFYLLFLFMLPANMNRILLLAIAFVIGYIMDKYTFSPGYHASACVLLGFIRPYILDRFFQTPVKESKKLVTPSLSKMGFRNFFVYIFTLLVIVIFYYYLIEFWSLRLSDILKMILKITSCLVTTLLLIILSQVLFVTAPKHQQRRR